MIMKHSLLLVVSLYSLLVITVICCSCSSPVSEPPVKEVPWTGEGPPPPPAPGTKWIVETAPESTPTSPQQTTEPSDEAKSENPTISPSPKSFDEIRRAMDTIESYAMTAVFSQKRDKYVLEYKISNNGVEMDLAVTESPMSSKLGSKFKLVLLGQEAYVRPKSVTGLSDSLLKAGNIELSDDMWMRIDLKETWPIYHEKGSYLSWHLPAFFTQVRAEIHRPLLFDTRIPVDFFDISVQGQESRDGMRFTHFLVQTDWLAVCQWLIDSGTLVRAWEGPVNDWWNSEVELWVGEDNLVHQMKVSQSDRFPIFWVVWIDEPVGSASYGYAPQFPEQDVIIDFAYNDIPEVVPPVSNAIVLTRDMLR